MLRTYLATGRGTAAQLSRAFQTLEKHHSASSLPQATRQKLLSDAMAAPGNSNWCYFCNQYAKKNAKFCSVCGGENGKKPTWYTQPAAPAPWQSQGRHTARPPSPRDRRRQSPRGRGNKTNKGGKGEGKEQGKGLWLDGKGKDQPALPAAPDPKALPAPPAVPSLAAPSMPGAGPSDAGSEAQAKLDALVAALRSAGTLPAEVMAIVGEQTDAAIKAQSTAMHRALNQRTQAAKELSRVRSSRKSYLGAWEQYLNHLCQSVEKQFTQQQEALDNFDQLEKKWGERLAESSATLSKLTSGADKATSDSEDDSAKDSRMEFDEEKDPWQSAQLIGQQRQQQLNLIQALEKARDSAAQAAASARTSSRTPRRARKDEEGKAPKETAQEEAVDPGKAPT